MGIMQEKFQIDLPQAEQADPGGWQSDASARTRRKQRGESIDLPPGSNLDAQSPDPEGSMPMVMSGESDMSRDTNPESFERGFKRLPMSPTDDEYTKAHVDAFYDEIKVDGDVAFTERNNVLDRL